MSDFADAKQEYELRLKEMSDDQLRAEFVELRWRYNPVRTELASRQIALRDRKNKTLRHLIGGQRMRAAVAKLKVERGQKIFCEPLQPTDDDGSF